MKSAVFFFALIAAFAFAASSASVDLSASPEEIAAQKMHWIERLTEKQQQLVNAKARYAKAQTSYQRMRTRSTSRGDKRSRVVAELKAAESALADAETELETTLAEARREGVPPGWIRDANDRTPTSPAAPD